jgi:hypothetical protein
MRMPRACHGSLLPSPHELFLRMPVGCVAWLSLTRPQTGGCSVEGSFFEGHVHGELQPQGAALERDDERCNTGIRL